MSLKQELAKQSLATLRDKGPFRLTPEARKKARSVRRMICESNKARNRAKRLRK